ncbi:MAG: OmpA family protein [Flavobacteriales bacterium]
MRVFVTASLLALALSAIAQQDQFQWRIAAHAGIDRSLSDIESSYSDVNWERSRTLGLELSKSLGYGVSLGLGVERAQLSGYDVLTGRQDRALNFKSELNTAQLELAFRMDNGKLLKYDARFAPFITLGVGMGTYDVFGDLYSASGSRYYYWDDGTIRDQAEGGSNAGAANVISTDGDFETRLTDLATENNKPKDQNFVFIPARIGLKWRICDRMAAELYYGFNWTFTDWIDDVHDAYPAGAEGELAYISNPTGRTGQRGDMATDDKYQSIGINLAYYFGRRSTSYRMRPVYVDDRSLPPPPPKPVAAPKPAPKAVPPASAKTVSINVEHITVGSLTVDTLVVGTLVQRGRSSSDSTAEYSIRKAKLDSIMAADTLRPVLLKSTVRDSMQAFEPDSMRTIMPDSMRSALPKAAVLTTRDTVVRIPVDSLRNDTVNPLDKLKQIETDTVKLGDIEHDPQHADKDSLVKVPKPTVITNDLQAVPMPGKDSVRVDTVYRTVPDSLREGGMKLAPAATQMTTTVAAPAPVIVHDTVRVTEKQVVPGRVDTVYIDRPGTSTRSEQQPTMIVQQPAAPQQQVQTSDRTVPVPVPVIVTNKETVREVVQDPALQDSLRKMQVENDRLRNVADSLQSRKPGSPNALPPGIRAGDYAGILTGLQADRIATLERYIEVMDNAANAGETDSLKQRIAEMDKEMQALRASRTASKDTAISPAIPGMKETLLDTVAFASGSSSVGNKARLQLMKTGKRLAAAKVERVLVTGQTDKSGNAALNQKLSQQRADAVKRVLVEAGVPVDAITAKGLGEKLAQHVYDESERVVVVQAVMP